MPSSAVVRMTGAAGLGFLVDTGRCYHMGSRVGPGRSRLMHTACYITWPAIYPNFMNKVVTKEPFTDRERLLLLP